MNETVKLAILFFAIIIVGQACYLGGYTDGRTYEIEKLQRAIAPSDIFDEDTRWEVWEIVGENYTIHTYFKNGTYRGSYTIPPPPEAKQ